MREGEGAARQKETVQSFYLLGQFVRFLQPVVPTCVEYTHIGHVDTARYARKDAGLRTHCSE